MQRLRGFGRRFRFPWRSARQIRRDVDDELAFHLAEKTEVLQKDGMSPAEARDEALRQFGDVDVARKQLIDDDRRGERRSMLVQLLEDLLRDIRLAYRSLARNPGFSAVAVVVLAIGIGVLSTMFSLVNLIVFQSALTAEPDALRSVYARTVETPGGWRSFSFAEYEAMRDRNQTFVSLAAWSISTAGVGSGDVTRRVMIAPVSANFFSTLGVLPTLGRAFTEAEVRGAEPATVVLSYPLWVQLGRDPDIVGSTVEVNGQQLVVVGVAAEGFTGPVPGLSPGVWVPLAFIEHTRSDLGQAIRLQDPTLRELMLVGRLREDTTPDSIDRDLRALATGNEWNTPAPDGEPYTYLATNVSRFSIGNAPEEESVLGFAVLLSGMGAVVLLIACLNLANMFLARGARRRTEMAIRQSLGSGRLRLIRQLLTEGLLLSIAGGILGTIIAFGVTSWIGTSVAAAVPFEAMLVIDARPDLGVFVATGAACIVATLLFGFGPAWRVTGRHLLGGLKATTGGGVADRPPKLRVLAPRSLLIVAQLALSLVMLTAGGLFLRGAMIAGDTTPGFSPQSSLLVELDPTLAGFDEARTRAILSDLVADIRAMPEISNAALASHVPFSGINARAGVQVAGRAIGEDVVVAHRVVVGDSYFATLRLPLVSGREFTSAESELDNGAHVAIVDQTLAEALFPGQNALGRSVQFATRDPDAMVEPIEIVGIAQPVRQRLIESVSSAHIYLPFGPNFRANVYVHAAVDDRMSNPDTMLTALRNVAREVEPGLPVLRLLTLEAFIDQNPELWIARLAGVLFTWLGAAALFMALVGVYGVMTFLISRRTREIGVRMALGATREKVTRQILGENLVVTAVGLVAGLVLAVVVAQLLGSLLFEVSPTDPLVFVSATTFLAATAVLAAYMPIRRASRIEPTAALRYE